MEDLKLVDVVMFALEEKGAKKGSEIPGSLVKFWRIPESLVGRKYGRYSGPHMDFMLGMAPIMRKRIVERSKKKPAYVVVEPVLMGTSADYQSWPVKAEDTSGSLLPQPDSSTTRFSAEHAKYFKDMATSHYRHGTMKDLDDECAEAIYMNEIDKIDKLVGRIVAWEFRPYIKTVGGAAAGVDEFRMQMVNGVKGLLNDESEPETSDGSETQEPEPVGKRKS